MMKLKETSTIRPVSEVSSLECSRNWLQTLETNQRTETNLTISVNVCQIMLHVFAGSAEADDIGSCKGANSSSPQSREFILRLLMFYPLACPEGVIVSVSISFCTIKMPGIAVN